MTQTSEDWFAEFAAIDERRRKKLPAAKQALLAALRRTRAAIVQIAYDGEGDGGQIVDIRACSARKRPVKLFGSVVLDLDETPESYDSLDQALDAFTWAVLDVYHAGFENNEGGFGTIDIDVAKGTVSIDHNDRISELCNTETEV